MTLARLDISEPKPDEFEAIVVLCDAQGPQVGPAVTLALLERFRSSPRSAMLVARDQEQVIGVILAGQVQGQPIQRLVIAPGDQKQAHLDVQRALIDKLLVKLSAQGVHTFPFALADAQKNTMLWHHAKWQGQANLKQPPPPEAPGSFKNAKVAGSSGSVSL